MRLITHHLCVVRLHTLARLLAPDERSLMELMISATQLAVPVLALVFVIIYFFCGIYFVYFDPKYNF